MSMWPSGRPVDVWDKARLIKRATLHNILYMCMHTFVRYTRLLLLQATQQFFAPATRGHQTTEQSNPQVGQADTQSGNPTEATAQTTYQSGPAGPGTSSNTSQTSSVANILAAVSEHASQKCGYSYDEKAGMYYDHRYAMYYDQVYIQ